jgi:hypothetical protein
MNQTPLERRLERYDDFCTDRIFDERYIVFGPEWKSSADDGENKRPNGLGGYPN